MKKVHTGFVPLIACLGLGTEDVTSILDVRLDRTAAAVLSKCS